MRNWISYIRRNRGLITEIMVWVMMFLSPLAILSILPEATTYMISILYFHLFFFILIYYTNVLLLIPRFLFKGRILIYILSAALLLLITNGLIVLIIKPFLKEVLSFPVTYDLQVVSKKPLVGNLGRIITYLLVLVLGVALKSFQRWQQEEQHNSKVQKEKLDTELAFLKNQINPHFFFNTMNTIYSLTKTNPEVAQETILRLSKLMRYLLYETEKQYSTIKREVEFVQDYVELMKIRLPGNVSVDFQTNVNSFNAQLPPLLFISFVENAFKHGISNSNNCSIDFSLEEVNHWLEFRAVNTIYRKRNEADGSGVGLENVKRRLELLFPQSGYELKIEENNNLFKVKLKMLISND